MSLKTEKKVRNFRFSDETMRKLDELVKFENNSLRESGIMGVEYNRTSLLELMIDLAHSAMKRGRSFQDVSLFLDDISDVE
jgi:hypothetical protein